MRVSRFGKRLALVSAAILFMSPAYAQTAPPQIPPIIRPVPPVTQPAPPTIAPIRPRTAQAGTVIARPPPPGTDADGDGSVAAGAAVSTMVGAGMGNDCDDSDASRYPGATEIANTLDEDCNPTTFGTDDNDGDGDISDRFSNPNGSGGVNAGDDCNDSVVDRGAEIHPGAQELPNRIDDNCDGVIDNLIGTWWTPR